jgi:hypothetical protein
MNIVPNFELTHTLDIFRRPIVVEGKQCYGSWASFHHQIKRMKPILLGALSLGQTQSD